jgi:ribosomal protein S18 acetylase RimI-like enzyme
MTALPKEPWWDEQRRALLVAPLAPLSRPSPLPRAFHELDLPHLGALIRIATASTPDASDRDALAWGEVLRHDLVATESPLMDGWLVIEDELGIAAFATTQFRDGRPFVPFLMTRPDAQSRGHASTLLGEIAFRMRGAGHTEIGLIVTRSNPAFEFYTHLGFRELRSSTAAVDV